jgi:3D (Asp-Asp-Asp) domain-containing protein
LIEGVISLSQVGCRPTDRDKILYLQDYMIMNKNILKTRFQLYIVVMIGIVMGVVLYGILAPQTINADVKNLNLIQDPVTLIHNGHLTICKLDRSKYEVVKQLTVMVTAYSSSWDETTGIPGKEGLITASGKKVADGVVAYNHLPFGTKIRMNIPGLEDKVFVVEDRTAAGRKNLDIWMPSKQEAINFGAKVLKIEVIES